MAIIGNRLVGGQAMKAFMAATVIALAACAATEKGQKADRTAKAELPKLTLTCQDTTVVPGTELVFDIRIENTTGEGLEFDVCENMKMCCVKAVHPTIECERCGGCSLLDGCKEGTKDLVRKTYLPRDAYLGVKVRIPASRLSTDCVADQHNEIKVYCVLVCSGGRVARSNKIRLALPE